ncbi:MAG: hypothetical protein M5U28_05830 [Sandaracinaceae bacterium]|nr:hypothetical protein [Sandaracinaceae bacterium]
MAVGLLTLSGCAPSNDLGDEDHVRTWANAASALAVFSHGYEALATADGQQSFPDAACPAVADDGTTMTITGDCTSSSGIVYLGTATVVRSGGDRSVAFDGYGGERDGTATTLTGTFEVTELADGSHDFVADFTHSGGVTTTFDYTGNVAGTYDGPTTWNGSGTVERSGVVAPSGVIEATTVDQGPRRRELRRRVDVGRDHPSRRAVGSSRSRTTARPRATPTTAHGGPSTARIEARSPVSRARCATDRRAALRSRRRRCSPCSGCCSLAAAALGRERRSAELAGSELDAAPRGACDQASGSSGSPARRGAGRSAKTQAWADGGGLGGALGRSMRRSSSAARSMRGCTLVTSAGRTTMSFLSPGSGRMNDA